MEKVNHTARPTAIAPVPILRASVAAILTALAGISGGNSAFAQSYFPANRHLQPTWNHQPLQFIQQNAGATQIYPNGVPQIPNVVPPTWTQNQPSVWPYLNPRYYPSPDPVQPPSPFIWRIYP